MISIGKGNRIDFMGVMGECGALSGTGDIRCD